MVQVDLITGFLGSGKTTFIQKYASWLMKQGQKVGIIENDYGSVNVDMMLLQNLEKAGASTEMVIASDLDCYRRRFRTKLIAMAMEGLDRVIVEPSGIYDVDEFFDALYEDPISSLCKAGSVISIVDAGMDIPLGKNADYLLTSQLSDAGIVLFSHMGDSADMTDQADERIAYINRILKQFGCRRVFEETFDPERQAFGEDILAKDWNLLDGADFEKIRDAGFQEYEHIKLQVESRNGFSSLYYMNLNKSREQLTEAAEDLMKTGGKTPGGTRIFRIKGFFQENGVWYELNATHNARKIRRIDEGQDVLIVIGESVNPDQVDRILGARHI